MKAPSGRRAASAPKDRGKPMAPGANGGYERNGNGRGAPTLTWANIISTLAFGAIMIGAFWTVMLTLLAAERERTNLITSFHEQEIKVAAATEKERTVLIASFNKERFDALQAQIDRREHELNRRIIDITAETAAHRVDFLSVREFSQYKVLIDQLRDQIKVIETTRPTTGELQAVAKATTEAADKIEQRVRSLEDNLRAIRQPAAVTVPR
jgi:hypothetical protein